MSPADEHTPVPAARNRTIRQQIIDCMRAGPVPIGVMSAEIGLSEKELQGHLESLRRQVSFSLTPARCAKCGFEFRNRTRTRKPGKCPKCRSTYITEPLYSLEPE